MPYTIHKDGFRNEFSIIIGAGAVLVGTCLCNNCVSCVTDVSGVAGTTGRVQPYIRRQRTVSIRFIKFMSVLVPFRPFNCAAVRNWHSFCTF